MGGFLPLKLSGQSGHRLAVRRPVHPGHARPRVPTAPLPHDLLPNLPDAKLAAVDKIGEGFDMDLDIALPLKPENPAFTMSFTVDQLRAMLAEAERREGGGEIPRFEVS